MWPSTGHLPGRSSSMGRDLPQNGEQGLWTLKPLKKSSQPPQEEGYWIHGSTNCWDWTPAEGAEGAKVLWTQPVRSISTPETDTTPRPEESKDGLGESKTCLTLPSASCPGALSGDQIVCRYPVCWTPNGSWYKVHGLHLIALVGVNGIASSGQWRPARLGTLDPRGVDP